MLCSVSMGCSPQWPCVGMQSPPTCLSPLPPPPPPRPAPAPCCARAPLAEHSSIYPRAARPRPPISLISLWLTSLYFSQLGRAGGGGGQGGGGAPRHHTGTGAARRVGAGAVPLHPPPLHWASGSLGDTDQTRQQCVPCNIIIVKLIFASLQCGQQCPLRV